MTHLYKQHSFRPWPAGVDFVEVRISPKWIDLCYVRPSDGAHIYLSSRSA